MNKNSKGQCATSSNNTTSTKTFHYINVKYRHDTTTTNMTYQQHQGTSNNVKQQCQTTISNKDITHQQQTTDNNLHDTYMDNTKTIAGNSLHGALASNAQHRITSPDNIKQQHSTIIHRTDINIYTQHQNITMHRTRTQNNNKKTTTMTQNYTNVHEMTLQSDNINKQHLL